MKNQALTIIEIEEFAPLTLAALDERRQPLTRDGGACLSEPKPRRRAALRWFIDTLALARCGMAGVYVGVWLDPPDFDPDSPDTEATE